MICLLKRFVTNSVFVHPVKKVRICLICVYFTCIFTATPHGFLVGRLHQYILILEKVFLLQQQSIRKAICFFPLSILAVLKHVFKTVIPKRSTNLLDWIFLNSINYVFEFFFCPLFYFITVKNALAKLQTVPSSTPTCFLCELVIGKVKSMIESQTTEVKWSSC